MAESATGSSKPAALAATTTATATTYSIDPIHLANQRKQSSRRRLMLRIESIRLSLSAKRQPLTDLVGSLSHQRLLTRSKAQHMYHEERMKHGSEYDHAEEAKVIAEIPVFTKDEIHLGPKLGKGAFGSVFEIDRITMNDNDKFHTDAARSFLAEHCRREAPASTLAAKATGAGAGDARYAIKKLRSNIVQDKETELLVSAMIDMAIETRMLASIPQHPNIIKMRGIAMTGGPSGTITTSKKGDYISCFHEDYFLILDRLYETLEDRLHYWKQQQENENDERNRNKIWLKLRRSHQRRIIKASQPATGTEKAIVSNQERERLTACHDLASALGHLHQHGIVHRDIKPTNIGFNIRGDVTLFDFGMARELPNNITNEDDLFLMTGFCGSPRYMAPEVGLRKPYNAKCDVYSFGMVAWEILTLQKPYEGCTMNELRERVWPQEGLCPIDWKKPVRKSSAASAASRKRTVFGKAAPAKPPQPLKAVSACLSVCNNKARLDAMIDSTFQRNIETRPTMKRLEDVFKVEVCGSDEKRRGSGSKRGLLRRRSTFVFRSNEQLSFEDMTVSRSGFDDSLPGIAE